MEVATIRTRHWSRRRNAPTTDNRWCSDSRELRSGTDVADGLRPGLQVEQIEAMLTDAGCEATDEMRDLWSWHNGSDASSPFIWYHDFLSLDEATSQFRLLRRMPLVSWPSDYLPAFSFDGEWYGLYCGGDGRDAGPVLHLLLEGEPRVTNVNLTALILQSAESMASGAITWQNGGMKEDISAVHQIHQQYNSGYPFPHYVEGSSGH